MIYIFPTDTCYGIACSFSDKKNYHKIYKIKKRSLEKPLAILVQDFDWLQENSELTNEQIDFLKTYPRPFTIITHSTPIEAYLKYQDEREDVYMNKDIYEHGIGFRVANTDTQKQLIWEVWPMWLTSANIAGEEECYSPEEIEEVFTYYLDKDIITFAQQEYLDEDIAPSDVFSFVGETTKLEYVRKL